MIDRTGCGSVPYDAAMAASLLAVDPFALGGISLHARPGALRDAWLERVRALMPPNAPCRRLPPHISDDRLLGGLDITATLASGRPVVQVGLLRDCDQGLLTLPMAERVGTELAAKLAMVIDAGAVNLEREGFAERHPTRFGVVLLDEGIQDDEAPPDCLLDRLAFRVDLDAGYDVEDPAPSRLDGLARSDIAAARGRLQSVTVAEEAIEALCTAALHFGIASARATCLALTAARAAAALFGRETVGGDETALAARLVLAPRATALPANAEQSDPAPPKPAEDGSAGHDAHDETGAGQQADSLENVVLAATRAAIPPRLLALLESGRMRSARDAGSGRRGTPHANGTRGRPIGVRRGAPGAGQRLNVLGTLRAAAPWQRIRRRDCKGDRPATSAPIQIRRDDFRVTRIRQRSKTTTIFVVDASGSAALHRLAEAKGAVELLLSECYVRRDSVALLTFGGQTAELLLPPTRSLTRVKRSLAGFPAGGGTPLATAIDTAADLAEGIRRKGAMPATVFLTDGRGNIARDGTADRDKAMRDTRAAARTFAATGLASILVDISPRARAAGRQLASDMNATYLALPHADAATLSSAVRAASPDPTAR